MKRHVAVLGRGHQHNIFKILQTCNKPGGCLLPRACSVHPPLCTRCSHRPREGERPDACHRPAGAEGPSPRAQKGMCRTGPFVHMGQGSRGDTGRAPLGRGQATLSWARSTGASTRKEGSCFPPPPPPFLSADWVKVRSRACLERTQPPCTVSIDSAGLPFGMWLCT